MMQEKESAHELPGDNPSTNKPGDLQNLITGIGAMAEMTVLYWNELLKGGIPVNVAVQLTSAFIRTVFAPNGASGSAQNGGDTL